MEELEVLRGGGCAESMSDERVIGEVLDEVEDSEWRWWRRVSHALPLFTAPSLIALEPDALV